MLKAVSWGQLQMNRCLHCIFNISIFSCCSWELIFLLVWCFPKLFFRALAMLLMHQCLPDLVVVCLSSAMLLLKHHCFLDLQGWNQQNFEIIHWCNLCRKIANYQHLTFASLPNQMEEVLNKCSLVLTRNHHLLSLLVSSLLVGHVSIW